MHPTESRRLSPFVWLLLSFCFANHSKIGIGKIQYQCGALARLDVQCLSLRCKLEVAQHRSHLLKPHH